MLQSDTGGKDNSMIDYYLYNHTFDNNKFEVELPEGFTECNIHIRGIRIRPTGVNKALIMLGTPDGYATARSTNSAVADVSNEGEDEKEESLSNIPASGYRRTEAQQGYIDRTAQVARVARESFQEGNYTDSAIAATSLVTRLVAVVPVSPGSIITGIGAGAADWYARDKLASAPGVVSGTVGSTIDITEDFSEDRVDLTNYRGELESVTVVEALADNRILTKQEHEAFRSAGRSYTPSDGSVAGGVSADEGFTTVIKRTEEQKTKTTAADAEAIITDPRPYRDRNAFVEVNRIALNRALQRADDAALSASSIANYESLYNTINDDLGGRQYAESQATNLQTGFRLGDTTQASNQRYISGDTGGEGPNFEIDATTGEFIINRIPVNIGSFWFQNYAGLFMNFQNENFVMDAVINIISNNGLVYILTEAYRVDDQGRALLNSEYISVRLFYGENPTKIKVVGYTDGGAYDATKEKNIQRGEVRVLAWV